MAFRVEHQVRAPAGRAPDVHVFDEADLAALIRGEFEEVHQLVVVEPADHHRVELQRPKPSRVRRRDPIPDRVQSVPARERAEPVGPEGVEADGDPVQARLPERRRLTGEKDSVGGQGDILDSRDDRNQPDQFGQVAADQRLPAGDPELPHPERREPFDDERRLVETQQVLTRQPHVLLLRHAVLAAEVAAVGDREAQAAERPAEAVTNGSGRHGQEALQPTTPAA